jgi:hypothetical protein
VTEIEGQAPLFTLALLGCTCDHPAEVHDHGFGCTVADPDGTNPCPCLGWWASCW